MLGIKQRFPRADALKVARFLCITLADHCEKLICAGSLRRRKAEVGDIELLFIPDTVMEPVDFFHTRLVSKVDIRTGPGQCARTGPGESNIRIAAAAQARGWKWNPYGEGFSRVAGLGQEVHAVTSEREVFEFVGLEYREPWER
jgi:DNA polymerase/3'-5' exonuclease PolX